MSVEQKPFHLTITGSTDFVRRMAVVTRRLDTGVGNQFEVGLGNLAELRALALEQRPDVVIFEVGFRSTDEEILWLRAMLEQVRSRLGGAVRLIAAITSPERFARAGSLLFHPGSATIPSGLIDDLLITPPAGAHLQYLLEEQLINALTYYIELSSGQTSTQSPLPSLSDEHWIPAMCDPASRDIWLRWLPRYARYVNENPLILGPSGSGKTKLAAALHHLSGRKGPFISITPRDFSSTELVQAELFGAVAGAYTGAVEKWGLVAQAEHGTLFIDELQSIDRDLQGKLITFIENKTYRRVGEAQSHQADVRFVFATNRGLQELVDSGALRDDFGYRLERLLLTLPPLSERRLDISGGICLALAKVLRERTDTRSETTFPRHASITGLSPEAYRLLFAAAWPGNLRQLENTVAKLVEITDIRHRTLIEADAVEEVLSSALGHRAVRATELYNRALRELLAQSEVHAPHSLQEAVLQLQERIRMDSLDTTGGDVKSAAALIHDSQAAMTLFAKHRLTEPVLPAEETQ